MVQKPKAVVVGPRKLYDFFVSHRGDQWDFVGHAPTVAHLWEGTSIDDPNDPAYIDPTFQILLTVDVLYNPSDQAVRAQNNDEEDNSLETLIASVCQNDSALVLIAQLKPQIEAQFRTAIRSAAQSYDYDTAMRYWMLPKVGVNRAIDQAIEEYIFSSKDRTVASILAGEEVEQAQGEDDFVIEQENQVADDFSDSDRLGRVIAVTSAKGGSGKSTVAVLLATYLGYASEASVREGLESEPLKVLLVDMDTRDSQTGFFVGALKPNVSQIVSRGISRQSIAETVIHHPRLKIDTLLAPRRPRFAMDIKPTFYRDLISALRKEYDIIVLDTSVNYLDPLLEKVAYPIADLIVFISDIGKNSILGMPRWIRETTLPIEKNGSGINPNKIGIVVNRAIDGVNMSPAQIKKASMGLPMITMIPNNARLVTHALNIQSMEKVLLHDTMRRAIGKIAFSVIDDVYKLSKNIELN